MQSGLVRLLIDKPSQIHPSYHGKRTVDPKALGRLLSRSQGVVLDGSCGRTSMPLDRVAPRGLYVAPRRAAAGLPGGTTPALLLREGKADHVHAYLDRIMAVRYA